MKKLTKIFDDLKTAKDVLKVQRSYYDIVMYKDSTLPKRTTVENVKAVCDDMLKVNVYMNCALEDLFRLTKFSRMYHPKQEVLEHLTEAAATSTKTVRTHIEQLEWIVATNDTGETIKVSPYKMNEISDIVTMIDDIIESCDNVVNYVDFLSPAYRFNRNRKMYREFVETYANHMMRVIALINDCTYRAILTK